MTVRRIAGGLAALAVAGTAAGIFASPAMAVTTRTVQLDATGMTASGGSLLCKVPLNGTIALPSGTQITFTKGLLSGLLTIAAKEKVTISPVDATGKAGTPVVKDQALDWTTSPVLKDGTYKLQWSAFNVLGILAGSGSGTLILSPSATTDCKLAVSVPTPSVSIPGLDPVNSAVNSLASGAIGAVNSAVAPVNSAVNQVTGALPAIPGVTGPTAGSTQGPTTQKPSGGTFTYKPWTPSLADGVVPKGYGSGNGAAYEYVPPLGGNSLNIGNVASSVTSAASREPAFSAAPTTTAADGSVDLAASKNRGILDSLSGFFVVLAFATLSGAIAYYVRNILMGNGGRFI